MVAIRNRIPPMASTMPEKDQIHKDQFKFTPTKISIAEAITDHQNKKKQKAKLLLVSDTSKDENKQKPSLEKNWNKETIFQRTKDQKQSVSSEFIDISVISSQSSSPKTFKKSNSKWDKIKSTVSRSPNRSPYSPNHPTVQSPNIPSRSSTKSILKKFAK